MIGGLTPRSRRGFAFAREWVAAWNAHDLERILSHYAEDVVLRSPVAARLLPESSGEIRGIDALRAWARGRCVPAD